MGCGKKGGVAVESLLALVLVVFTAATVFFLVSSGIVSVNGAENSGDSGSSDSSSSSDLLNIDFVPISQGGVLIAKDLVFCAESEAGNICSGVGSDGDRDVFYLGEEVHFSFEVVSSSLLGKIELLENYQLYGPDGTLLLSVNDQDDISYVALSEETIEQVYFHDYFILEESDPIGEYTLEIVMTNPIISKEAVIRKTVTVLP